MDVVAVVGAELDILIQTRPLELPIESTACNVENLISSRGSVGSDVNLAVGLVNAVPPVGADGSAIVVIPIAGLPVCHLMGMSGKEMNLVIARQAAEQCCPVRLSVKVAGRGVHRDNYRCGLGYKRKILCQPCKLLISNQFVVLPVVLSPSLACAENIVKDDIMHLADVERVEIRGNLLCELNSILEVSRKHHVVVMVSDRMENRQVSHLLHVVEILSELILPVIPVIVPGHVAQCHCINLVRLVAGQICIDLPAELP